MRQPLSRRERTLAMAVGAIIFLFGNYLLINWAWEAHRQMKATIAAQEKQLRLIRTMASDLKFWEKREAWLQAHQPALVNSDSAAVQLLDQIKSAAKKNEVLLENPVIRVAERQPEYVSISVEIETKSAWQPLTRFLREFQSTGQFLVIESANLKVDTGDATQMRGRFRVAQWFAPR